MTHTLALVAIVSALCAVLGLAGWWADWYLTRFHRRSLPPPDPKAIGGQSHKPWM